MKTIELKVDFTLFPDCVFSTIEKLWMVNDLKNRSQNIGPAYVCIAQLNEEPTGKVIERYYENDQQMMETVFQT